MAVNFLEPPEWRIERRGSVAELRLIGDWIARESGVPGSVAAHELLAQAGGAASLRLETGQLGRWDSALIIFVQDLRAAAGRSAPPVALDESGLPESARRLLTLAAEGQAAGPSAATDRSVDGVLTRIGRAAIAAAETGTAVAGLVGQTVLRGGAAMTGGIRTRAGDVLQLMREAGAGALGIVLIVNGLVGGILAFVGAVQLRQFGAEIFVADLVGIAMVREMAAVMTGIVLAGRTGGSYAAQLATMQGNEEIDALKALGIPVYDYLILPRIFALVVMMPLLYLYACAAGLVGGLAVASLALELAPVAYFNETVRAVGSTQFLIGLTKSVAFGVLIALAGCHIGLRAGRSAADVGRAATSAVVISIIGVIALDAVFAVCADALGF